MVFFDEQGNQISFENWLKTYEPYYFLNGPKKGRSVNGRNQSSRFVEDSVCSLLSSPFPLAAADLTAITAWKIGMIDHVRSEAVRKIVYKQEFAKTHRAKVQFRTLDFSTSIPALASKMPVMLAYIRANNPRYVFDLAPLLPGFGYVYILTVLFFASRGRFPIYDKYAHLAAVAIQQGRRPGSPLDYKGIQKWRDYENYMGLLGPIGSSCPKELSTPSMLISRPLDRALWVYGHFFGAEGGRTC